MEAGKTHAWIAPKLRHGRNYRLRCMMEREVQRALHRGYSAGRRLSETAAETEFATLSAPVAQKPESGGVFAGDGVDGEGGSFGDRYVRYADNRGNRSRVCGCVAQVGFPREFHDSDDEHSRGTGGGGNLRSFPHSRGGGRIACIFTSPREPWFHRRLKLPAKRFVLRQTPTGLRQWRNWRNAS